MSFLEYWKRFFKDSYRALNGDMGEKKQYWASVFSQREGRNLQEVKPLKCKGNGKLFFSSLFSLTLED